MDNASNPRFSVLLPTHNRADVLGVAIKSVLAQTEPDFELLIVADGCTDNTRDVIAQFKDPRIRLFDLPKAAHFGYANRNIALRASHGRLIAFAAHDDILLPDHLELMGNLLDSSKASWGYSRPLWISTDGIIVPFCTNLNLPDEYTYFMEQGNTIPASCVVHTRAALERAGYWPEHLPKAADWALWKQIIKYSGGHLAFLKQPTTLHFSANWKQSRHSSSNEVKTLISIADTATWWPTILRTPPNGTYIPEQVSLWHTIEAGKDSWVISMRSAIDTVIDRIAWTSIREVLPAYEVMLASNSWRITKTLRILSTWLRGP
ncbi:MAG: glycosyltransferase family 2 protein [Parachlamydiaceae bacterium]|nr:glycosyltransferase family 2 protein [Parachlamydiaceae bacterium]